MTLKSNQLLTFNGKYKAAKAAKRASYYCNFAEKCFEGGGRRAVGVIFSVTNPAPCNSPPPLLSKVHSCGLDENHLAVFVNSVDYMIHFCFVAHLDTSQNCMVSKSRLRIIFMISCARPACVEGSYTLPYQH